MAIKQTTKKEKQKIMGSLRKKKQRQRRPLSVMFELTYRCNFKCLHCYLPGSHQEKRELTTKEVFQILDQLKKMGVFHVSFTGGEPLVREDIFDILGYASRSGFRVSILSNGYYIDKKVAGKLKKAHLFRVAITLHAMDSEIFDQITGVKGSFSRVKEAVEILKGAGLHVSVKTLCMELNKNEIFKISRFARDLGIRYNLDGEIMPSRDNIQTCVEKYSVAGKEYQKLRREVYPEMFAGNKPLRKSNKSRHQIFNCGVGINSFSIDPYGEMNFCLEINYPKCHILSRGAEECWETLKKEVDRLNNRKDFVCKDCDLFKYCGWCPGRSYLETGSFNRCSWYFKQRAIDRKMLLQGRQ